MAIFLFGVIAYLLFLAAILYGIGFVGDIGVPKGIDDGTVAPLAAALAINVGTAPLAFLIGGGGLGELIFTGIDLNEPAMMLAGAIPTALLAVLVDYAVGVIAFFVVPQGVNPLR